MLKIFKKIRNRPGQLEDVQLRPVEQKGAESLDDRLARSRNQFGQRLMDVLSAHKSVDEDLLEELEPAPVHDGLAAVIRQRRTDFLSQIRAMVSQGDPFRPLP